MHDSPSVTPQSAIKHKTSGILSVINILFYLLFGLTPLLFSFSNSELFELPKTYFVYLLTSLLLGLHLISFFQGRNPLLKKNILTLPLLLFLCSQTVAFLFSFDKYTSFFGYYGRFNGGLLSLFSFYIIYLILSVHITPPFSKNIQTSLLLGSIPVTLYALAQHFGVDAHLWQQDVQARVFSTFGQPNWLASYLCILLPLSLYRATSLYPKNKIQSFLYVFYALLCFIVLCFTSSQSGLLACAIALLTILVLSKNRLFLIPVFVIFLFISLLLDNPLKEKLFPSPALTASPNPTLNITPSGDIRKIVWAGSLKLVARYPLFGTGPETFGQTYYWVRPREHNDTSEWNFLYNKAHNEYLNYLANTGFFGLISYLIFVLFSLFLLYKTNIYFFASFITILVTNFFGFSTIVPNLLLFTLPIFAISSSTLTFHKKKLPLPPNLLSLIVVICLSIPIFYISSWYLADLAYTQTKSSLGENLLPSALQSTKAMLLFDPNNPNFQLLASQVYARLAVAQNNPSLASLSDSLSRSALSTSPSDINFYKLQFQTYLILGSLDSKYYLSALNSLQKAVTLAPTDAAAFYQLATYENALDLKPAALSTYQQAVSLKPNYDLAWYDLGLLQKEQKMYSDAKKSFESVLKINPSNSDAKAQLSQINSIISKGTNP